MTSEKPVILVVHGAFHRPIHYNRVLESLREKGFTAVAPTLPTTGIVPDFDYEDDVKVINQALGPLLDAGKQVIIVAHCFGALPASHCVEGESVAERKECGMSGGIKAYINVCGLSYAERGLNIIGKPGGFPMRDYYHAEVSQCTLGEDVVAVIYIDDATSM